MSDKINNSDDFEDGLRHILSPGTVKPCGEGIAPGIAVNASARQQPAEAHTRRLQAAADKLHSEQRVLKIFKILRIIAAIALVALLASFVYRITNPDVRNKRRYSQNDNVTNVTLGNVTLHPINFA